MRFAWLLFLVGTALGQTVDGVVVDAGSGAPIVGARVKLELNQNVPDDPVYTKTGPDGRFRFLKPQAAVYRLEVNARGYLAPNCCALADLSPGGRNWGGIPPVARSTEADGTIHATVRFELTASGVISGEVTDPYGVPLVDGEVEILQKAPAGSSKMPTPMVHSLPDGQFELVRKQMVRADDRGRYRIGHLEPGTYYVVANRPQAFGGIGNWEATYRPTYYPGAAQIGAAKPLEIAAGGQAVADIRIARQSGVRVSGRVNVPASPERVYTQVRLHQLQSYITNDGQFFTGLVTDRFELANVPAGKYLLTAVSQSAGSNPWGAQPAFGAMQTVEVADHDVSGLDVTVKPLPDVAGTVVFAEGCKGEPLHIRPQAWPSSFPPPEEVAPAADGSFVLKRLPPGRYSLYIYTATGLPQVQVQLGGREVPKEGFEVPFAGDAALRLTVTCATQRRPL